MKEFLFFYFFCFCRERDFKLFVLSGKRTNQLVSTLGELDHSVEHERRFYTAQLQLNCQLNHFMLK